MPRKKGIGGEPYDVAFPITQEARKIIEEAVMAEYTKKVTSKATRPKRSLQRTKQISLKQ
jgi:DNA-binding cell septation regulator SpoVG